MNAADRATLQAALVKAIEQAVDEATGEIPLPVFGESTFHHMAIAALNVWEAIEDVESYIGEQLGDETREELGL